MGGMVGKMVRPRRRNATRAAVVAMGAAAVMKIVIVLARGELEERRTVC